MGTKLQQRVAGLVMTLIGMGFTYWEWLQAIDTGTYHPKAAMLFPAFTVLGLGILIFPISKQELMAQFGIERPQRLRHYPLGLRVFLVLALIAGALDWALISGALHR